MVAVAVRVAVVVVSAVVVVASARPVVVGRSRRPSVAVPRARVCLAGPARLGGAN